MKKHSLLLLPILLLFACTNAPMPEEEEMQESEQTAEMSFAELDEHAKNTPAEYEANISSLAQYLVEAATTEEEQVRALFTWVATHIRYDDDAYNTGNYGDLSAEGVLKSRKAVCDGYGSLLKTLCDEVGIEAEKVSGYSKGYGYQVGKTFKESDHAWNAIKLDGQWKLFDATWAAGTGEAVNGRLVSKQNFNDYWYDVPPKEFVFTHLPEDQKWQLLDEPLSMGEYQQLPRISGEFFAYGFDADQIYADAKRGEIMRLVKVYSLDKPTKVIQAPYQEALEAGKSYTFRIEAADAEEVVIVQNGEWTEFERHRDEFHLRFTPNQGECNLMVKFDLNSNQYHGMLKYQVD